MESGGVGARRGATFLAVLAAVLLYAALAPASLGASAGVQDPIDLGRAREYFRDARTLSDEDAGRLWGVELYGPLLFVDPASRFVVANLPDSAGHLGVRAGVYVGTLPPEGNVANTAVRWSGREWTMLIWPLPSLGHERRRLLGHELFHRVQDELGLPARDPPNAHLGEREGRIWIRLEFRALAAALVARGAARAGALADALAFREHRRSLFTGSAAEERALELNEGLAEYTGLALSGLPEHVLADRAAVGLERREGQESLARAFAYATGPAYGVLLDEAGARWRDGLSAGADLGALAADAYGIELPAELDVMSRAARHDGVRVIEAENARAERQAALMQRLRGRFLEGPTLTLPVDQAFRYSFNPNDATPLPGVGTVYGSARVTDVWGVLSVESGGVLLVRSDAGITRVVVPVPPDTHERPLAGDGWRLELAQGWTLRPASRPGDWMVVRE